MADTVKQVLLVEDSSAHATLIRAYLQDFIGLVINWVRTADEALEYLTADDAEGGPRMPDLILLDLKLPGTPGPELLARLKADERLRRIPVVVLTTSDRTCDIEAAYDSRANSYLVKTADPEKMREMLHNAVAYWCAWNRLPERKN